MDRSVGGRRSATRCLRVRLESVRQDVCRELHKGGFLVDLLDFILLLILLLGALNGYRLGFIREVTRLFGGLIAYVIAYRFGPDVAPLLKHFKWASKPPTGLVGDLFGNFSGAIAFLVVFLVAFIVLRYAAGLLDALFSLPVLSFVNRLAGLVAGLLLAGLFIYIATLIMHYISNPGLQFQLRHSVVTAWLDTHVMAFLKHPTTIRRS